MEPPCVSPNAASVWASSSSGSGRGAPGSASAWGSQGWRTLRAETQQAVFYNKHVNKLAAQHLWSQLETSEKSLSLQRSSELSAFMWSYFSWSLFNCFHSCWLCFMNPHNRFISRCSNIINLKINNFNSFYRAWRASAPTVVWPEPRKRLPRSCRWAAEPWSGSYPGSTRPPAERHETAEYRNNLMTSESRSQQNEWKFPSFICQNILTFFSWKFFNLNIS